MAKNRFFDIFTSFSLEHGPFFSKWWPSEENAKKSIFFAEMACTHVGTKYTKRQQDFENFLIFRHTLIDRFPAWLPIGSGSENLTRWSQEMWNTHSSPRSSQNKGVIRKKPSYSHFGFWNNLYYQQWQVTSDKISNLQQRLLLQLPQHAATRQQQQ